MDFLMACIHTDESLGCLFHPSSVKLNNHVHFLCAAHIWKWLHSPGIVARARLICSLDAKGWICPALEGISQVSNNIQIFAKYRHFAKKAKKQTKLILWYSCDVRHEYLWHLRIWNLQLKGFFSLFNLTGKKKGLGKSCKPSKKKQNTRTEVTHNVQVFAQGSWRIKPVEFWICWNEVESYLKC